MKKISNRQSTSAFTSQSTPKPESVAKALNGRILAQPTYTSQLLGKLHPPQRTGVVGGMFNPDLARNYLERKSIQQRLRITPEMRGLAVGNKLAKGVLRALEHEGMPNHLTTEEYLARFAYTGWDKAETVGTIKIVNLHRGHVGKLSGGYKTARRVRKQDGTPTPMPTPDFLNPCEGKTGDALKECYEKTLQLYGVGTMDADDLKVTEVKGKVGDLEQFSYEQLAIILQGVQTTGTTLAKFLKTLGKNVTAAEAFRLIYGSVEFGYDVDQTSGLTITTSDSTNHNDIIYILLNDSSFGLSSTDSQVGFETLPDSFVVVHELGHAFANRHSQKNDYGLPAIAASEYVKATNATWYPGGGYTTEASIRGLSLKKASDATGKQITNAQGQPLYIVPSGLFMPGNYEGMDRRYFFNELRPGGSNPGEGFADTFASFFLNPDVLPIGANRRNYFEENMPQWVKDIVCPERNCDEIS